DFVHGVGEGHRAVATHSAVCRAEPADAAIRRRAHDRAPGFRADRKCSQARSHDRARTGTRSAGPTIRIPRIFRSALQRGGGKTIIHSSRKLDHCRFPDEYRANTPQMFDYGSVEIEELVFVWLRPPGGRQTIHAQQIFSGVWNSV